MQILRKRDLRKNADPGTTQSPPKGISARRVDGYLRFVLFLTVVGLFYIWNTHYAVKQVRKMEALKGEVKELKSKFLMRESTLRAGIRLSEISDRVDSLGLYKPSAPPYKLVKINEKSGD